LIPVPAPAQSGAGEARLSGPPAQPEGWGCPCNKASKICDVDPQSHQARILFALSAISFSACSMDSSKSACSSRQRVLIFVSIAL